MKSKLLTGSMLATLCLCAASLATGCAKEGTSEPRRTPETDPVEILPGGGIASPERSEPSQAAGVPSPSRAVIDATHEALDVCFARLDQLEPDGAYGDYASLAAPLQATMARTDDAANPAAIRFDTPQYYLSRETNNNTRLVGWYPRGRFDAGVVTLEVDGQSDIMLSDELSGNKAPNERFGTAGKIFRFGHCLTLLRFKAYAAEASATSVWGAISGISILAQPDVCRISLPGSVEFEGNETIPIVPRAWSGDTPIGYPLAFAVGDAAAAVPCGYALIRPVAADGTLPISVSTLSGGSFQTSVPLPADGMGFQQGKAYEIRLRFAAATIEPSVTVTDWVDAEKVDVVM